MQAKLKTVGELIRLAFQVRDDVLDVTSFEENWQDTTKRIIQG